MEERIRRSGLFRVLENLHLAVMPVVTQVVYFMLGFVLARTEIFGGIAPLGLAFTLGVPNCYAIAAGAGAVVGYASGLQLLGAAKYLAAVCISSVMRWVFTQSHHSKLYANIVGNGTLFVISLIYLKYFPEGITVVQALAEVMLCVGISWLFCYLPYEAKRDGKLTMQETVASLALCVAVLAALFGFNIFVVNVGAVVGACFMLCCAYTRAERGSALAGAVCVMACILTGGTNLFVGCGIALGGMLASIIYKGERVGLMGVFCGGAFLVVSCAPTVAAGAAYFSACIFGSVLFLIMPLKALHFTHGFDVVQSKNEATYVKDRLFSLAQALEDVKGAVEDVCAILPKQQTDPSAPIEYACDTVCKNCKNNTYCWVTNYYDTMDMLTGTMEDIKKTGFVTANEMPKRLSQMCKNMPQLCGALNRGVSNGVASLTASTQAQMLKTALAEQYGAMASALFEMSDEIWHEERIDSAKTTAVKNLFCEMELEPLDLVVLENREKALRVQVKTERVSPNDEQLQAIAKEVSHCCKREFTACEPCHTAGITTFTFLEKPMFTPQFFKSISAAEGGVSADIIEYFCDDKSNAYMVLCDGMGTGEKAAIDGKMAAALTHRLLSAGFGCESVAKLVNVALCLKSEEETGATLDVFCVNLFTGKAIFFKAGAAPSFILHNGKVEVVSSDSLPIGSTGGVTGCIREFYLKPGDTALLASDGLLAGGEKWVSAQLVANKEYNLQTLADNLVEGVKDKVARQDDISVAMLKLA